MVSSNSAPLPNPLKVKLSGGQPVMGVWSIIPSALVTEIFALSGMDFAILDMEHGVFDVTALESCVRACEAAGAAPLVRIPGLNASAAQWALDVGAYGIVAPQVGDAREADTVVQMAKYAPRGTRGYNPFTRAALYANPPDNQSGKLSNDFSLTCVIIESQKALDNLQPICETQDLDVVYVGTYDLSVAMGCNGNTKDRRVIDVVKSSVEQIRTAGKAAGMMVRSQEDIIRALDLGANFLVYSVDTSLIREAVSLTVQSFHQEQTAYSRRTAINAKESK